MPPGPVTPAHDLRRRAAGSRHTAAAIEQASAINLHQRGGADTWVGPTPTQCHDALLTIRSSLIAAAAHLRASAAQLDRRAQALSDDTTIRS